MKLFIVVSIILATSFGFDADDAKEVEDRTRILSRKKRFLTFPDGSSFQLVFCTANVGFLQIGDTVFFGNIASLAWELPSDPEMFDMLKKKGKVFSQRRQDNKLLVFLDEDGKVLSTKSYRRKPIVNPAFAKRSISDTKELNTTNTISINNMHEKQKTISKTIFQDLDETKINFHRDGRMSLYDKLNKFFQALGLNGKECVLRMLCESVKPKQNQGSFYEEILRATFTMPHHKSGSELNEYDIAHRREGDCAMLYPKCEGFRL